MIFYVHTITDTATGEVLRFVIAGAEITLGLDINETVSQRCNRLLKHRHDDSLTIGQARAIVTAYYLKGFCQKCHNEKSATHHVLTRYLG